ncbi:MAG: hypothetical protein K8T90_17110, partial [Planctomycetes bacterium]|nr:hypothetical protein [Planctomycetota bacterium]
RVAAGAGGSAEVCGVRHRGASRGEVLCRLRDAREMTMPPVVPGPSSPPADTSRSPSPPRRRTWLTCLLVAIGVVLLAVGGILGFVMFIYHDY